MRALWLFISAVALIGLAAQATSAPQVVAFHPLQNGSNDDYSNLAVGSNSILQTVNAASAPINVAQATNGGAVVASSTYSDAYPAAGVIDGDRKGLTWGSGGGWNDGTATTFPDWLEVDFNGTQTISEVDVFSVQDNYAAPMDPAPGTTFTLFGLRDFEVQYWTGSAWAPIPGATVTGNNLVWRQFTFAPLATAKIRVFVTATADGMFSRITEIEAYTGTSTSPTLSLTAPANNSMFTAPATVNLSANASDVDSTIFKVNFYRDEMLIATVTTPTSGTTSSGIWTYSDTSVSAGAYSYTAKAFDNASPTAAIASNAAFVIVTGAAAWNDFARDAKHTALSPTASQALNHIHWQTPVDLQPQYSGDDLLIHYGSVLITAANTVIVPVKTGATGAYRVEARGGSDGALMWTLSSDYILPPHNWTPVFGPALTSQPRLYFPGAGGTVYFRDQPDESSGTNGQIVFYGLSNYQANPQAYDANVMINTPLVSDSSGNIYFGFLVTGNTPLALTSGIARISASGQATWIPVTNAAGDPAMSEVAQNSAPALSPDLGKLYVAVSNGSAGYLVVLDSTTLAPVARVKLKDPKSGQDSWLSDDGTASPSVGPDGDVYFGVLESPAGENHYRGWLLHFDGSLSQSKTPGAFGWDDTASLVPAQLVSSYQGASAYLLMSKYNNYAEAGGDGQNRLAILDPNATQTDPVTLATVMKEVLTIAGPTPDLSVGGVKEWCINSAAVDPQTKSILANSEDGTLYRWDLTTNTLSQSMVLTSGIGEAYTSTVIGADGSVYAINNGVLFSVGL